MAEKKVAEISNPPPCDVERIVEVVTPASHQPIPPPCNMNMAGKNVGGTSDRAVDVNVDLCRICFTCGVGVWIGSPKSPSHDVPIAYPLGSDWSNDNVQPYCETCWKAEVNVMQRLGSHQYKAIGDPKKTTSSQVTNTQVRISATLVFPPRSYFRHTDISATLISPY